MRVRTSIAVRILSFAIGCIAMRLDAGNVNYNFNQDDGGWTSTSGWRYSADPKDQKSWKLLAEKVDEEQGNYLFSPCFCVTDESVQFIINEGHRFNFGDPTKPEKPPGAGQLQFSTKPEDPNSWLGIGLSGGGSWSSSNNDVAPTLDPATISAPAPLLASGLAFVGISKDYGKPNNNGVSSLAILPALQVGTFLQFRFLGDVRDDDFCPDPQFSGPIWDVNKVLIKGVTEHACPEPCGLALAAVGMLIATAWVGASRGSVARSRIIRAVLRSTVSACVLFVIALVFLLTLPQARAVPIVNNEFDFADGPLGWTPQPVGKLGLLPPTTGGKRWTHANGQWEVNWSPVSGPLVATGNYLTSPLIDPAGPLDGLPVDAFRISFAHKFNFPNSSTVPPAAGQVVYSINGGPYTPLPVAAWSTGNVTTPEPLFGPNPLWPTYVGQTELVVPGYTPPTGIYSDLFPLINGGASFTGVTPGYSATGGTYVPSVAVLDIPLQVITDFRVRLINANLGSSCPADAGWDVRYLQVDFAAPEPGSLLLAAAGISGAVGFHVMKRRRRRLLHS